MDAVGVLNAMVARYVTESRRVIEGRRSDNVELFNGMNLMLVTVGSIVWPGMDGEDVQERIGEMIVDTMIGMG